MTPYRLEGWIAFLLSAGVLLALSQRADALGLTLYIMAGAVIAEAGLWLQHRDGVKNPSVLAYSILLFVWPPFLAFGIWATRGGRQ